MWSLIHTQPKRSAFDTRSARPTSRVQTEEARPYGVPLAHAIASLLVGERLDGDDRAEDLALDHLVVLLAGRRRRSARGRSPGRSGSLAAGDDLGVLGRALEEALDALALARGVERAERRVRVERVADLVARAPGRRGPASDVVVDLRAGEHARRRRAVLAGVVVAGAGDRLAARPPGRRRRRRPPAPCRRARGGRA